MNSRRLIWRSLTHHARSHLGVVLGAAVGSAALIGALLVGDSIRGSLRSMALARLGDVTVALEAGDRFVRDKLADEISFGAAPLVQVAGTATRADGEARANNVQVIGIDERLAEVTAKHPRFATNATDSVILNTALASHLGVKQGGTVLLRVQKPSLLSREAPITPQQDSAIALRLTVAAIAGDDEFGRFSLRASQVPPHNAFVPLRLLQQRLELGERANVLLVSGADQKTAEQQFKAKWQPADAELEVVALTNAPGLQLNSRRVFVDTHVVHATDKLARESTKVLTYFVNEIRSGERSTPYSMVTAAEAPLAPEDLRTNEIVINEWLAEDLQIGVGADLQIRYYAIGGGQRLDERTNTFRVKMVVPLMGVRGDRALMPEFPGIAKAESTENWDAGFPIEMGKIRSKDEAYWKQHRGTPKAFISLDAGQSLWGNRFGNVTAIRFPAAQDTNELGRKIIAALEPAAVGLSFQPVREQALAAGSSGQDFGQLFLGFSFFLILAALILMGLMFQFGLEQRVTEIGTLLALGFRPKQVRRIFFAEALLLALIGGVIGTLAGAGYARAILNLLTTVWRDAVGTSSLAYHAQPQTYLMGLFASVIVAAITIAIVLRKHAKQPAHELLARGAEQMFSVVVRKPRWTTGIAVFSGAAALAIVGQALASGNNSAGPVFFVAGAMLLIAGICAAAIVLNHLARATSSEVLSASAMGVRSSTRRRPRSVATVALLAAGTFMVIAIAANRLDADVDAHQRSSGTGGFALIGETALPVFHDLNTADGRDFFGLNAADLQGVSFVPFRVRDGDDASCLNLNRAQQPRLLGVDPSALNQRNAFTFSQALTTNEWASLRSPMTNDEVPAVGDANSIKWALGRKVGDTLDYIDEQGNAFKIRIAGAVANSILQGSIIIDERAFVQRFPGEGGYRMFFIDAPSNTVSEVSATLSRALQDVGLELTPAAKRLAQFNAVQNTYLNTFQVLGGLGLLIGTAGLGVVVLRNVLERRGEFGLLLALGYPRRLVRYIVLSEHVGLLAMGLGIGVVAALCAVAPFLFFGREGLPIGWLAITLTAVLFVGLLCTMLATWSALRGNLLAALRNE